MNNHTGLAFSSESITFASFEQTNAQSSYLLDRVGFIEYPFVYEPHRFYREENIPPLGELLQRSITGFDPAKSKLSVSIESNLAALKHIVYPKDFNDSEIGLQISWEIRESMPLASEHYVYMRTQNFIDENESRTELVIIIPKKIISFISGLSNYLKITLNNMSLHALSVESAVRRTQSGKPFSLLGMIRIVKDHIETIVLRHGNFLYSFYDLIQESDKFDFESSVLERIKGRINSIENLFEQYKFEQSTIDKLFLYGNPVMDSLLEKIRKNISIEVDRFNPMENLKRTETFSAPVHKDYAYSNLVECIGVALDL